MPKADKVYVASLQDGVLCQGEIISNLIQVVTKLDTLGTDDEIAERVLHTYAIVVSQDCDLTQDYDAKLKGDSPHRLLSDILFCEAEIAEAAILAANDPNASEKNKGRSEDIKSKKVWGKIEQNNDFRYQYLRKIEPKFDASGQGLEPLLVDFNRTFSIPRDEVYQRFVIGNAEMRAVRRTVLVSPYLEHLAVRFHHFHCRIALPLDHHTVEKPPQEPVEAVE